MSLVVLKNPGNNHGRGKPKSLEKDTGGNHAIPCPCCGDSFSKIIDARPSGERFRRRRVCLACGVRYTTFEVVAEAFKVIDFQI